MKRTGMILLAVFAAVCICSCTSSEKQNNEKSLIVFNYGDYIDRDVLEQFEEETGIKVEYEEYITPEDMYTKYKSGVISYDVINLICGKRKEISPVMYILSVLFILKYVFL